MHVVIAEATDVGRGGKHVGVVDDRYLEITFLAGNATRSGAQLSVPFFDNDT